MFFQHHPTLCSFFFIIVVRRFLAMSRIILATILLALLLLAHPTNADKEFVSRLEEVSSESQPIQTKKQHFVLVHGACHGAWQWYKLIPTLQKAGHNVTAVDLGASGRRPEKLTDLNGFPDYVKPLVDVMEGLPASEKVILVGHSFGGISLAWVSELYPEKILAGVFVAAFMPDTTNNAFNPFLQYSAALPPNYLVDAEINLNFTVPRLYPTVLFGPIDMRTKLYQACSEEDLALGLTLIRITSGFQQDLTNTTFTMAKYGAVPRIYIVGTKDLAIQTAYQRVMIQNFPPREVKEINTDHMQMLSAPLRLLAFLLDIANRYKS